MMLIDNQDNANAGLSGPTGLKNKQEEAEDSHGAMKGGNEQLRKIQSVQQAAMNGGISEMDQFAQV